MQVMKNLVQRVDTKLDSLADLWKDRTVSIPTNLLGGLVFFLIALGVLLLIPSQITVSESDVVNGQAFPTLLVAIIMLCSLILVGKEVIHIIRKEAIATHDVNLLTEMRALLILVILLFTYFIIRLTGLFVVGACFCSLSFLLFFRCKKPLYYAITLVLTVTIWACFRFVLGVKF